ncbi:hypothetical protein [Paenibacillus vini]|uniref:Uncharacterized protein n=1 Tax=Paenibacillus vini TaxID=1476024 RepID=A0ABQ4MGX1_9BACL|nr:hypothetical protein [Paenibacillus vini]GIP55208.1 hypothetical protein J42TS3_42430 [Paenibacillus vini]
MANQALKKRLEKLEQAIRDKGFIPVVLIGPGDELPPGITDKTIIIIDDIGCDDEDDLQDQEGIAWPQ